MSMNRDSFATAAVLGAAALAALTPAVATAAATAPAAAAPLATTAVAPAPPPAGRPSRRATFNVTGPCARPLATATPGERFVVAVSPRGEASSADSDTTVRVSLLRLSSEGGVDRTIFARSVHSGR